MTRQQKRKLERENHKMKVFIKVDTNLPQRTEELSNQLVEASMSMLKTFGKIKERFNLNDEISHNLFQFVVHAHNEFMKDPYATPDTYKEFEKMMWGSAERSC